MVAQGQARSALRRRAVPSLPSSLLSSLRSIPQDTELPPGCARGPRDEPPSRRSCACPRPFASPDRVRPRRAGLATPGACHSRGSRRGASLRRRARRLRAGARARSPSAPLIDPGPTRPRPSARQPAPVPAASDADDARLQLPAAPAAASLRGRPLTVRLRGLHHAWGRLRRTVRPHPPRSVSRTMSEHTARPAVTRDGAGHPTRAAAARPAPARPSRASTRRRAAVFGRPDGVDGGFARPDGARGHRATASSDPRRSPRPRWHAPSAGPAATRTALQRPPGDGRRARMAPTPPFWADGAAVDPWRDPEQRRRRSARPSTPPAGDRPAPRLRRGRPAEPARGAVRPPRAPPRAGRAGRRRAAGRRGWAARRAAHRRRRRRPHRSRPDDHPGRGGQGAPARSRWPTSPPAPCPPSCRSRSGSATRAAPARASSSTPAGYVLTNNHVVAPAADAAAPGSRRSSTTAPGARPGSSAGTRRPTSPW